MNIYTPYCVANGGGHAIIDNFVGHYWSLSLEEQFLVFPFLFFSSTEKPWLYCWPPLSWSSSPGSDPFSPTPGTSRPTP